MGLPDPQGKGINMKIKAKARTKECAKCGCARVILVKSKVLIQCGNSLEATVHQVCFPCLLRVFGLLEGKSLDYHKAMKCVGEK